MRILIALLCTCSALQAQVRFPDVIPVPTPVQPAPTPGGEVDLAEGQLYVFDTDVPVLVFTFPENVLKFVKEEGPLKINGIFDNSGKRQTKTFKGKFVYTSDIIATGRVTLLVIPVGADSEEKALKRIINVVGPRPPPGPGPGPGPTDPLFATFQAAFTADGGNKDDLAKLAAIYRVSSSTIDNPVYKTIGELWPILQTASNALVPLPKLATLRRAIGDDNNLTIYGIKNPGDPALPLDNALRTKLKAQFAKITALLEVLK